MPPKKRTACASNMPLYHELHAWYQREVERDSFLRFSIRKAISALEAYPLQITSGTQAQQLEGIGPNLGAKIEKFLRENPQSGVLDLDAAADGGEVAPEPAGRRGRPKGSKNKKSSGTSVPAVAPPAPVPVVEVKLFDAIDQRGLGAAMGFSQSSTSSSQKSLSQQSQHQQQQQQQLLSQNRFQHPPSSFQHYPPPPTPPPSSLPSAKDPAEDQYLRDLSLALIRSEQDAVTSSTLAHTARPRVATSSLATSSSSSTSTSPASVLLSRPGRARDDEAVDDDSLLARLLASSSSSSSSPSSSSLSSSDVSALLGSSAASRGSAAHQSSSSSSSSSRGGNYGPYSFSSHAGYGDDDDDADADAGAHAFAYAGGGGVGADDVDNDLEAAYLASLQEEDRRMMHRDMRGGGQGQGGDYGYRQSSQSQQQQHQHQQQHLQQQHLQHQHQQQHQQQQHQQQHLQHQHEGHSSTSPKLSEKLAWSRLLEAHSAALLRVPILSAPIIFDALVDLLSVHGMSAARVRDPSGPDAVFRRAIRFFAAAQPSLSRAAVLSDVVAPPSAQLKQLEAVHNAREEAENALENVKDKYVKWARQVVASMPSSTEAEASACSHLLRGVVDVITSTAGTTLSTYLACFALEADIRRLDRLAGVLAPSSSISSSISSSFSSSSSSSFSSMSKGADAKSSTAAAIASSRSRSRILLERAAPIYGHSSPSLWLAYLECIKPSKAIPAFALSAAEAHDLAQNASKTTPSSSSSSSSTSSYASSAVTTALASASLAAAVASEKIDFEEVAMVHKRALRTLKPEARAAFVQGYDKLMQG